MGFMVVFFGLGILSPVEWNKAPKNMVQRPKMGFQWLSQRGFEAMGY
jgi:hypothetical protein